jgi:hypothetical protein
MALTLLNPGLRPLGMFDLADADAGLLVGGEYVELAEDGGDIEGYAADVPLAPLSGGHTVRFGRPAAAGRTAANFGGLADEGGEVGAGYGTLFGSLIGQRVGQATEINGAVVLGPSTDRASGKVTVWHAPGLYGVSDQDASLDSAAANAAVHALADGSGLLEVGGGANAQVAIYVGAMTDTSLVSTTATAVGETTTVVSHAIYYLGNVNQ